jgi:sigma54-dependent transcription regulator
MRRGSCSQVADPGQCPARLNTHAKRKIQKTRSRTRATLRRIRLVRLATLSARYCRAHRGAAALVRSGIVTANERQQIEEELRMRRKSNLAAQMGSIAGGRAHEH